MEFSNILFINLKLLGSILENLPPKSILEIDANSWYVYKLFGTRLDNMLQFQISRPDDRNVSILLDDKCLEWLKHYLLEMIADQNEEFHAIDHYRICNYEMTDILIEVYDTNMFTISKKLKLDKTFMKQWEKYNNVYFCLVDSIPDTKI